MISHRFDFWRARLFSRWRYMQGTHFLKFVYDAPLVCCLAREPFFSGLCDLSARHHNRAQISGAQASAPTSAPQPEAPSPKPQTNPTSPYPNLHLAIPPSHPTPSPSPNFQHTHIYIHSIHVYTWVAGVGWGGGRGGVLDTTAEPRLAERKPLPSLNIGRVEGI